MNTVDKNVISNTITDLTPGTDYYFALKTWTDPHGNNDNKVTSDYSAEVTTYSAPPGGGGGGGCFIATAAYGFYSESHVMVLREFRDDVLLKSAAGTALVDAYYTYSPPVADYIAAHPALRTATRIALEPVVYGVKYPLALGFIVTAGGFIAIRRRKKN